MLSTQGLGPLALGGSTAAGEAARMIRWNPTSCGSEMGMPGGRWEETYPGQPFTLDDDGPGQAKLRHAKIVRIDVFTSQVKTDRGIRVGSTEAQLKAAYGNALTLIGDEGYARAWMFKDGHGAMHFEVGLEGDHGEPVAPKVTAILVATKTSAFPMVTSRTDDIAGGC